MERRTRILIAEDDAQIRSSLRSLVERLSDVEVVAEADDGEAAVKAATLHQPDIALMDIHMAHLDGLEATARISREARHTRVIIVSIQTGEGFARRALGAGARGYVSKDAAPLDLESAIRVVSRGGVYISSHLGTQATGPRRPADGAGPARR